MPNEFTRPSVAAYGGTTRGFQATAVAQIADATSESPIIVIRNKGG